MEIERKFLVSALPRELGQYPHTLIEQAYLNTSPVVRVRRDGDNYYMTYKGSGMMIREEYNLPLNAESYLHLLAKADGTVITKIRYRIPLDDGFTAELDVFSGTFEGLVMVEVEFETESQALSYQPPEWFGDEVTDNPLYHNSTLSRLGAMPVYSDKTE